MARDRRRKKVNWHEIRVGVFVLICLALMVFMLFRVTGGRGFFSSKVRALTYLPATQGMKPGAPVWLNGIEVGHVEEITLESTLPSTKANGVIQSRIREMEQDMVRTRTDIEISGKHIQDLRTKRAAASEEEARAFDDGIRKEEDRLAMLRKTYEKEDGDIKTLRGNLQSIRLILQIDKEYAGWIMNDSEVSIGSIGLLGDNYVNISIGRLKEPAKRLPDGTVVIEGVSEATLHQMMLSASQMMGTFEEISDRVKSITVKVDEGQGTIGKLVNNSVLHDTLVATTESLRDTVRKAGDVMTDLQDSQGTIGQLIKSKELYVELKDTISQVRQFAQKLNTDGNSLDRLLKSSDLYDNLLRVTSRVDNILKNVEAGKGTLGKLNTDDTFFVEAKGALAKLHQILAQVEAGQGTLGKLLKDPALFQSLNEAVAELAKFLMDVRKDPKKYLSIKFRLF